MDLIATAFDLEALYTSTLNVKNFGAVNYLGHESADVYLMSVAGADGLRWSGRPESFDFSRLQNRLLLAHNSALIWDFCGPATSRCRRNTIAPRPCRRGRGADDPWT
jgi:hypothetical protein